MLSSNLPRALAGAALIVAVASHASAADGARPDIEAQLAEIEAATKGHLGVAILDTKTGDFFATRENERFALCSTFKVLAATLVLDRVDHGQEKLDRVIPFTKKDLVPYSPVTEGRAGSKGMTLGELTGAAMTHSDNTAANLVLNSFGGPKALTAYLRSLGDKATRIDRMEPVLNKVSAGDPRDTTTPRAMAYTLQRILLGNVLTKSSEKQLIDWLTASTTGGKRLKAGLPKDWRIGDKTGTCKGAANDVAIIWPPNRAPVIVAAYLKNAKVSREAQEKALADVGRAVAAMY
jgi:beta-lactamase class A